jgi:hypothetical protein
MWQRVLGLIISSTIVGLGLAAAIATGDGGQVTVLMRRPLPELPAKASPPMPAPPRLRR